MSRAVRGVQNLLRDVSVAAIVAVGVLASVAAFLVVSRLEREEARLRFEGLAIEVVRSIERESSANLRAVHSLVALYDSSETVTLEEFRRFGTVMLSEYPSLRAVSWNPLVRDADRERFEREIRADGLPGFRIERAAAEGEPGLAGPRSGYVPVVYIVPVAGNEAAVGYDIASEAVRRSALEVARDTGETAITQPITLVQDPSVLDGILAVAPLYDGTRSLDTEAQRREALTGYVVGVFDIGAVVDAATEGLSQAPELDPSAIDVRIDDAGVHQPTGERSLVFSRRVRGGEAAGVPSDTSGPRVAIDVAVANRTWHIVASQPGSALTARQEQLAWAVLIAGLALTAVAVYIFEARRRGMERLAELTEQLRDKNRILEGRSEALSRFVGRQLYDSIRAGSNDTSIGAARKQLTLFFADLEDFTGLSSDLDPDALAYLLNDYFAEVCAIATEHGATIDKLIGDALFAYFGDPQTQGDAEDALACLRMAVAVQQRMVHLREKWHGMGLHGAMCARIGISTGDCLVGNFGGGGMLDHTAIGEEVNIAFRLHKAAEPNGIVITERTHALIAAHVSAERLPALRLRGVRRSVVPYRVLGLRDARDADAVPSS